ncbi:MAG TPA: PKD domain-containing protein [Prolixibacteraceae bacterium]|nr:PKD domain-containing protein [Prolixibacteraceae bacterium]
MKSCLTLILALFTITGLFAQAECTVKIVYSMNKSNPPSYTFKTDPQITGAKYYWSFGDNKFSDSPAPTHAFTKTDSYLVQVKVSGSDGKVCYGELKAQFEGGTVNTTVTTLAGKGKVKKTASTDGCGLLITMENGSVLVPVEMAMAFEFQDGQYVELAYELLKDRPSGCTSGVSAKIIKIAAITPGTLCTVKIVSTKNSTTPASYTFKTDPANTATGTKYYWYFGDNTTSDSPSPTHTYAKEGSYLVQVKVLGADGKVCYGELKAQFAGGTVAPPVTTLTAKGKVRKVVSTDGCGLLITLDNGTVIVPVEMAVPFEFRNDQYVELAYQLLKDKPSGCASGVSAKIIKIADITPATICTVKIVNIKNTTTPASYTFKTDPANTATGTKYYWYFGDNTTSDSPSPTHTYAKEGSYLVQVKVLATDGKVCYGELKAQFAGGTATTPVATLPACKGPVNLLLYDPTDKSCNGKAVVKLLDETGKEVSNVKYKWSDGRTGNSVGNLCPEKQYTVQAIIENVCQKNTSFTLLSKPLWSTSTLNGQNNFKVIEPVEGVQYEWNFGDGKVMTGSSVNYNFQKDGVYDVTLKAVGIDGSSEFSQPVVVMQNIAKTDLSGNSEMEIYPNPAKEVLSVDFNNTGDGKLTFEIRNMAGQVVYTNQINNDGSSHADINVQNLKTGMYLLRIYNGQQIIGDRKFIKTN